MPPDGWISLARMGGQYGMNVRQTQGAAKKLGIRAKRGAALLSPGQQTLMHAELSKRRKNRDHAKASEAKGSRVVYRSDDEHDSVSEVFPQTEIARHLKPLLRESEQQDGTGPHRRGR